MARRRLATLAMSNRRVQDALAVTHPSQVSAPVAFGSDTSPADAAGRSAGDAHALGMAASGANAGQALAVELESLAQEITNTPGAGGALLATFAEQSRVLQLVAQAASRAPEAPLPYDVIAAVRAAVSGLRTGVWDASPVEN